MGMLKIRCVHYLEALSKYHFGYNIHCQALECRVEIDWRILTRQFVELSAKMVDLALELVRNRLHSAGSKDWMEYLASYLVSVRIDQTNGRTGKRDASIESRLLVESGSDFGDFLEVVWRVDVEFVDPDSDDRAYACGLRQKSFQEFSRGFVPYRSWSLSISNSS